ncbi:MAG TPA: hypothetical protein VIT38_14880 [Allosphingosinicella sp.]
MRKFLISAAIATATVAALPASAQDYGRANYGRHDDRADWNRHGVNRQAVSNLLRQIDQVDRRIQVSAQRRILSQREAFSLRRESSQIRGRLGYQARNGLSGREFAQLQVRVNRLEQRLRYERRDRDGRVL